MAAGVSDGTHPDRPITREQFVTMLCRYAGHPAPDAEGGAMEQFVDAGKVSSYAVDAMRWGVSTGIIRGVGNLTLAPSAPPPAPRPRRCSCGTAPT